jgi:tRNA threonylcarbamoyladenosine biosynthesis protein TsaB
MRLALVDSDGLLSEVAVCRQRRHAESLHPAIEAVCRESGVGPRDLSAVAVDIGPGLFTGLRVGVTTAKMLAVALDLPVLTATSLAVLARWASGVVSGAIDVLPVIDMRRGEVAWQGGLTWAPGATTATGAPAPSGAARPVSGAMAPGAIRRGTPDQLVAELTAGLAAESAAEMVPTGPLLLVGDGAQRYAESFRAASPDGSVLVASPAAAAPQARTLGELAIERLLLGSGDADVADAATLVPLYLRDADVAIGWETRTPVGSA